MRGYELLDHTENHLQSELSIPMRGYEPTGMAVQALAITVKHPHEGL